MKFKLEIDLGEIEGLRTGKHLAGILHGLAFTMWTASEPLHPARYGVTDPSTMATCGAWEVMPDDEEHIKRAVALQSVAPHLSMVEALEATQTLPDPNALMIHPGTASEHSAIKAPAAEHRYCSLCRDWFYRHPSQAPTPQA